MDVRRFRVLLILLASLACNGCSGRAPGPEALRPGQTVNCMVRPVPRTAALSAAEVLKARLCAPPQGVSQQRWRELLDELERVLAATRSASQPPQGDWNNLTDLSSVDLGGGQMALRWSYRNVGDYDINSQVNIADLTPIGVNYGRSSTEAGWDSARLADGDENGEVNISDITPIGQNFGATLSGYDVFGGDSAEGPWTELGRIETSEAVGEPLPVFTFPLPQVYAWYLIVPFDMADPPPGTATLFEPGDSTVQITDSISSAGGVIEAPAAGPLEGVTVSFPAAALPAPTEVALASNDGALSPRLGVLHGAVLDLQVEQRQFYRPIEISMPYPGEGFTPLPYHVTPEGRLQACDVITVDEVGGSYTFLAWHASPFLMIVEPEIPEGGPAFFEGTFFSDFEAAEDGMQIENQGSIFNNEGECLGMTAFTQWYHRERKAAGGNFYPRFMQQVGSRSGQQVIATRAHTSMGNYWSSYALSIGSTQVFAPDYTIFQRIRNALANSAQPVILHITTSFFSPPMKRHAVLVYGVQGQILHVYDPNYPGDSTRRIVLSGSPPGFETYDGMYSEILLLGDGSLFLHEPFQFILEDAESAFDGSNDAQVSVTSHASGAHVSEHYVTLSGEVQSGDVLIEELQLIVNGKLPLTVTSGAGGAWEADVPLQSGSNFITFKTLGLLSDYGLLSVVNSAPEPFELVGDFGQTALLVTLTWDDPQADLDLYVTNPAGETVYYDNALTQDGGFLDRDDTNGYGPEHYSLELTDNVSYGEEYEVRVHYYDGLGPVQWNVRVLLNEATSPAESSYSGILAQSDSNNDEPGGQGPDWVGIGSFVPLQQ